MKYLFSILLALTYLSCTAQEDDNVLRNRVDIDAGIYQVIYSESLEQPLNVKYKVLCPDGTASRSGMNFYKVDSIHTSDNNDYYKNVWDKGHMAPAADFNCTREMLIKTFSYLNSALQHKSLNRGEWRMLEEYERVLSETGSEVEVEIEIIFDEVPERVPANAAIPKAFKKHLVYDGQHDCYYFLNEPPPIDGFENYKIECDKH